MSLVMLDVSYNRISSFGMNTTSAAASDAREGRPSSPLQVINMEENYHTLYQLPDDWFVHMPNLTKLSASNNGITELQDGLFDGLRNLERLELSYNNIASIGTWVFSASSGLLSLRNIDLSYNLLDTLDTWIFEQGRVGTQMNPANFKMDYNNISNFTNLLQWNFSCSDLQSYAKVWLSDNFVRRETDAVIRWGLNWTNCETVQYSIMLPFNLLECGCRPTDYEYQTKFYSRDWLFKSFTKCSPAYTACTVIDQCPTKWKCAYRPHNATVDVHCSRSSLSSLPISVPLYPSTNKLSYKLRLSNNRTLRSLANRGYLGYVSFLDASNCGLETVEADALKQLLESSPVVLLNSSKLKSLPSGLGGSTEPVSSTRMMLDISRNPWECSCGNAWMIS